MLRRYIALVALLAVAIVSATGCTRESDPRPESTVAPEPAATPQPNITLVPTSTVVSTPTPDPTLVAFRATMVAERLRADDHYSDESCIDPLSRRWRNRLGKYVVKWSPDGSRILFNVNVEDYSKPMDLYSVDADGLRVRKIIDGSLNTPDSAASGGTSSIKETVNGPTMYFDISPDGARVAYSTCTYYENQDNDRSDGRNSREYRYDIFVVNIDGTGNKNVTEKESIDIFPAWSPDGSQIAFVSEEDLDPWTIEGQLVIYTLATGELSEVPLAIGDRVAPYAPAWSPDGRTIAFVAYDGDIRRSTTTAVYTVGIDGSGLTRISTTSTRPSWSPDGRRIAFVCALRRRSGVLFVCGRRLGSCTDRKPPLRLHIHVRRSGPGLTAPGRRNFMGARRFGDIDGLTGAEGGP